MADRRANRGMRDEAGVGPNPRDARRLIPLKELDHFQVADGEPDIRGWSVYTATGRELGAVEDLLVDTEMGEVVMLDVDLKRNDRHTLAPVKAAWIDRGSRRVVLNTAMFDADEEIPALSRSNAPESDSVRHFNERYERAYGTDGWDRDRDITIRHANNDIRITRSVPPPPATDTQTASTTERPVDRPVDRAVNRSADAIDRTGDAVERAADKAADAVRSDAQPGDIPQPERRQFVRYGPSRDKIVVEEVVRRRVIDPADLSPAETERLRQQAGDITSDARDTLVNAPPTEERR